MRSTQAAGAAIVLVGAALLVTSGCAAWSTPAPRVRDYRLAYPLPQASPSAHAGVLHVLPFTVAATYDSRAILYRQGEFRIGRYPHDRWAASPGNLVADLLARDLDASGVFRAVQQARTTVASDFRLAGDIDVIEESSGPDGCAALLELRVLLVRLGAKAGDRVLLRRSYSEREPSRCEDAAALARAMSSALERISLSLRADIEWSLAPQAP